MLVTDLDLLSLVLDDGLVVLDRVLQLSATQGKLESQWREDPD